MQRLSPNRRVVFASGIGVLIAVAMAFATAALGTGSSDSQEIAQLKRQVAALQAQTKAHPVMLSKLAVLNVTTRVAYLDAVGFHGLEHAAANGTMTDRDATRVKNALKVASKIAWPEALAGDASAAIKDLRAFAEAWDAGDKKAAFEAMKALHGSAHALSASAYQWLG